VRGSGKVCARNIGAQLPDADPLRAAFTAPGSMSPNHQATIPSSVRPTGQGSWIQGAAGRRRTSALFIVSLACSALRVGMTMPEPIPLV